MIQERTRFFEKKARQKTFVTFYTGCCNVSGLKGQKFFAELFFKKATVFLF